MSINILIPMTGPNTFDSEEYIYPKPLIDIAGRTILERSFDSYKGFGDDKTIIPIVSLDDVRAFNIDYVIRQLVDKEQLDLIELDSRTGGALCTCLLAIDKINSDDPLIITNSDHIMDYDVSRIVRWFDENEADFGVVSFEAVHPKWSYVRVNEEGEIEEAAEKRPISKNAIAGMYYYKRGRDFIDAAKKAVLKRATHNDKYFISASLNEMVLKGRRGLVYEIPSEAYTNFYDISAIKSYHDKIKQSQNTDERQIRKLTKQYVDDFDARRLDAVTAQMHEDFSLEDPVIKRIDGRDAVKDFLNGVFNDVDTLHFSADHIAVHQDKSFIQFKLQVDDKHIRGVDIITWSDGKMESLVAHMEEV